MISTSPKGKGVSREIVVLIFMVAALVMILGAMVGLNWQWGEQTSAGHPIPSDPEFAPRPEFEPLEQMDREFLENYTWDHTQQIPGTENILNRVKLRKQSHDLMNDYPALLHAVRYLRTLEKAGSSPEGGFAPIPAKDYMELITTPYNDRGRPVAIAGRCHEIFNTYELPDDEHTKAAGAQRLSAIYFRDVDVLRDPYMRKDKRDLGHKTESKVYLVVSPHDLRPFLRRRLVSINGVFIRRWPPDPNRDFWLPVIVTLLPTEQEVTEGSSGLVLKIVLAVIILLIGGLLLFGQRERAVKRKKKRRLQPEAQDKQKAPASDEQKAEDKAETKEKAGDARPSDDEKTEDKPSDDKPADDKPADKKSNDDKPADKKSNDDKPADDKSDADESEKTNDADESGTNQG